jgi:hypothetical protein
MGERLFHQTAAAIADRLDTHSSARFGATLFRRSAST